MRLIALLLTLSLSSLAAAQSSAPPPVSLPVPGGAPDVNDAPPVTIKPSSQGRVVEYRANGRLYMLKIIPRVGKPYYLIDQRGDGQFARQDSLDSGLRPPMWVIKEF